MSDILTKNGIIKTSKSNFFSNIWPWHLVLKIKKLTSMDYFFLTGSRFVILIMHTTQLTHGDWVGYAIVNFKHNLSLIFTIMIWKCFPVKSHHKRPVIESFYIFFVACLGKLLNKQPRQWWSTITFVWHHCGVIVALHAVSVCWLCD